jgi:signal transduction histidine kinase
MRTALVVDDEPASLRAVGRALRDECRVLTAGGGAEALAILGTEAVALVVTDQRMPDMTGIALLAAIATQSPQVIRILLTGYTAADTLVDAINTGHVYSYLTKPWTPAELRVAVRRGLERYDAEAERRRLDAELQAAYRHVQREADQKGRLIAVAAHELGTPVHVLSNALAFLSEADLLGNARSWLDMAVRSAEWLGRGLKQLRTASQWHEGAWTVHRNPVDLHLLLVDVCDTFTPICATRRLSLCCRLVPPLPVLLGDRVWLSRAFTNLLSNAVRWTPDGGTISVEASVRDAAVDITVSDTGVGIEAHLLEEIFEPFSPAAGDPSLHGSGRFEFGARGLGLGLAITKAIVARHGGSLVVRSAPGRGSVFTLSLPFATAIRDDARADAVSAQ